ncbi:1203_t:CDS:2 [Entrophospora sp. SA101]|nr:10825_t:CDS:2 [Entrophospora sp. SA101]CAJ0886170.1 1203_t:CDS:2 [Entrophospora sp. SA101]
MSQGFTRSQAEKLELSKLPTERLVEKLNDKFINEKLHTPDISDKSFSYSNEIAGNDMLAALSEVISEKIWDELSEVGVIIDESTDIT